MAVPADIQAALETKLSALATVNSYPVAWPNVGFTPTDAPYLMPFNLQAEPGFLGLENGSEDDNQGVFQVDVRVKKGDGTTDARNIIDALYSHFAKGESQTINSTKVVFQRVWASASFDIEDGWHSVPVSITYRAIA